MAPVWDRQTERTKERRQLHPSSVPLYNILQASRLCQQRLSNISWAWHDAACEAVCSVTQRTFCNDGSEGNIPHILNLDTSQRWVVSFTPQPLYPLFNGQKAGWGKGRAGNRVWLFSSKAVPFWHITLSVILSTPKYIFFFRSSYFLNRTDIPGVVLFSNTHDHSPLQDPTMNGVCVVFKNITSTEFMRE